MQVAFVRTYDDARPRACLRDVLKLFNGSLEVRLNPARAWTALIPGTLASATANDPQSAVRLLQRSLGFPEDTSEFGSEEWWADMTKRMEATLSGQ